MAAPAIIPQGDLSVEEIERIQQAQHFISQVCSQETLAIWKLPKFSENWQIYLNNSLEGGSRLSVDYGNSSSTGKTESVKFTFNLMWYDPIDYDDIGGLYFYFRPTDIPQSVKRVGGKYRLEILKSDGQVWNTWDSPAVDWRPEMQLNDEIEEIQSNYYHGLMMSTRGIINNLELLGETDTLTLRLTFKRMTVRILEYPNPPRLQEQVAKTTDKILPGDMEALLHDPTDADVLIKTKDGAIFKAHKLILKRRVAMFRAMFETDMLEKSSGMVETPEISSGAMIILLHYIYTGKLHQDWKQWKALAHEVINGAQQYGLDGLIQYYDRMLVTLCNDIDAKDLLQVATVHGLKQAEEDIGKWINGMIMD